MSNVRIPKVAILMATFNGDKYLIQQIDSILVQQGVEVFIYIRDDRSTDSTLKIIQEYTKKTDKVVLLDTESYQLNAAKNFMSIVRDTDILQMDYIAYSDQDDYWLPFKLHHAITAIENKHADCYASNLIMGDSNARIINNGSFFSKLWTYLFTFKTQNKKDFDFYFESASAGCTLVLNKQAGLYLQKRVTSLFDLIPENASHDWSTYAITRLGGFKWFIDDRSYIIYRQHHTNAYGSNLGWKGIAKLLNYFNSGWYRNHILMIEDLYNNGPIHPPFIAAIKNYKHSSIVSRIQLAFAVYPYRRKWLHRILFFLLIILGYFK